ncbi:Hypothetical predicted protein [Podarcis lilfordi]|uniref:Uncharacterized protein n=1 Tax=Podarcis lilfordi TaxID=74358 RepID=A0AA35PQR9_9SAUR|nr:Hypothetical predicted protein [Podarcis lilfordi]
MLAAWPFLNSTLRKRRLSSRLPPPKLRLPACTPGASLCWDGLKQHGTCSFLGRWKSLTCARWPPAGRARSRCIGESLQRRTRREHLWKGQLHRVLHSESGVQMLLRRGWRRTALLLMQQRARSHGTN